jgi:hypothetical protein
MLLTFELSKRELRTLLSDALTVAAATKIYLPRSKSTNRAIAAADRLLKKFLPHHLASTTSRTRR